MRSKFIRLIALAVLSVTALLGFAAPAFANEGEAAAESSVGTGLLFPGLGEWIPMLIGFILLWLVLAKFGWPAFIGMIDKRTATIKDSLERAENAKIESERILAENKAQLDEAKKQAAQIIADAKTTGESVRAQIVSAAEEEARLFTEKSKAAIETEKKAAIAQLQSSVANLSVSVASKLIGQDLSDNDHRRLIERYLAEAGDLNAN